MAQHRRKEEEEEDAHRPAPSLDDERRMLAELLKIDFPTVVAEAQEWIDRWPVALRDQLEASVRDAHVSVLSTLRAAVRGEGFATDRTRVKVWAALIRSALGHHCPHVGQLLPTFAFPAARLVSCADCLPGFKSVFVVSDQRIRDHSDLVCDLCLEEATVFTPFIIQMADTVIRGDACNTCVEGG